MSVRIGLLADHPEVLLPLASAFACEWPEWYGVHGDAVSDLRDRSRRSGFPLGLVALDAGKAIGALTIAEKSVPSHPHLSPWLIGFWVESSRRNRGIGAQLLTASCRHAREQNIDSLFAASAAASRLFAREGWLVIDTGTTDLGATVKIFSKATNESS